MIGPFFHGTSRGLAWLLFLFSCLFLAACTSPVQPSSFTISSSPSPLSEATSTPSLLPLVFPSPSSLQPSSPLLFISPSPLTISNLQSLTRTPTPDFTPTPDTRPLPSQWRTWPIVPTLSANMIPVFLDGQAKGKNPTAFSTLGDCQSEPPVFMGIYDTDRYYLGTGYEYLQETIDFFAQSDAFGRQSYCTQNGLSVASALSPTWADPAACLKDETPLACEIRLYQPSLMFINLGTNWSANATASHENYLRQIVDILLAEGILPILSTKGDNVEGDWSINKSIAQVAYDYDLPLWNFWAAIQNLPQHGLDPNRPGNNYLIPEAWDRRSFTGLQVLDSIRQTLEPYYP